MFVNITFALQAHGIYIKTVYLISTTPPLKIANLALEIEKHETNRRIWTFCPNVTPLHEGKIRTIVRKIRMLSG